jgi:hypothetical protein
MEKGEQKALDDIAKYGCHILHVFEDDGYPRFTYSIGIQHNTGQPELIVTGLKRELAIWIINEYNNRIKAGEIIKPNTLYEGFLDNFEVMFKKVKKKYYSEYFGWAYWLYKGDKFKVLQLIYPTTSGVWLWDNDAPEDLLFSIPKLYES